ncbi:MopE-related protein [Myxococcota bacterium]
MTGDGRFELIGTWSSGIWYRDVARSQWVQMWSNTPPGGMAAADFTGDGKADVASIWNSGLWYQDGVSLRWHKVTAIVPRTVTAGNIVGTSSCTTNDQCLATEVCVDGQCRARDCTVDTDCSDDVDCTMDTCVDGVCVFWNDFCDLDGDGFSVAEGDCDDSDPSIYPGAPEICDGIDQDCNDVVDNGCDHRRVTLDPDPQLRPTVSGTRVAYMDYRLGGSAIFMFNLATGIETQVTDRGFVSPYLDGDRLIMRDMSDGGMGPLVLYDLTSNTSRPITSHRSYKDSPFIRGDSVVWHEERNGNWDVYYYDIRSDVERRITTDPASDADAKISGHRIVFNSNRRGQYEVYLYDLDTGTETLLAPNGRMQATPTIEGDLVVWREPIGTIFNVIVYDLATEERRQITPSVGAYNNGSQARAPRISGNLIVWTDFRHSVEHPPENADIYLYNLDTDEETQVTSRMGRQNFPAVSGAGVLYTDDRNGDYDIYLSAPELSATPDAVEAGDSTTVSWHVPPGQASTTDRIGLYVVGAPRGDALTEKPTGGASDGVLTFALPAASGTYELRYLAGEDDGPRSNPVTVSPH